LENPKILAKESREEIQGEKESLRKKKMHLLIRGKGSSARKQNNGVEKKAGGQTNHD